MINRADVINGFPKDPGKNEIIYYVYNRDMVKEVADLIANLMGDEYYNAYVSVRPVSESTGMGGSGMPRTYDVERHALTYFDPSVFLYRNNGYN